MDSARDQGKRAGVYGRQSASKQKSIAEQLAAGTAAVEAAGWHLAGTYQDGASASRYARKSRDDWARVQADIAAGALDVLVLWESSRGDRTPETWFAFLSALRTNGVRLHVITHERTYNLANARDWKVLAEDGVNNAYESDLLSVRVRRGHAGAAAEGRPGHGRAPYGYRRTYDAATGKLAGQEPDPEQAPVVRRIIGDIAKGVPVTTVAKQLNADGVPAPEGDRWYRNRVRRMTLNPAYVGLRHYNGQTYPAQWPALVDEATWYAAQRVLKDPARRTSPPGLQRHLLSYLALAPCGAQLMARRGKYHCSADGCVKSVMEPMDAYVTLVVLARLSRVDVYAGLRQAGDDADKLALAAGNQAAQLRDRLDGWRRSAAKGETTPESLAAIEAELTAQIADADRRAQSAALPPALRQVLAPGADVAARWAAAPLPAKRDVIRALMVVRLGPAATTGRVPWSAERLGGSTWVGDDRPWRELADV